MKLFRITFTGLMFGAATPACTGLAPYSGDLEHESSSSCEDEDDCDGDGIDEDEDCDDEDDDVGSAEDEGGECPADDSDDTAQDDSCPSGDEEDCDGDGYEATDDCDDTDSKVGNADIEGGECPEDVEDECLDKNGSTDPLKWDCDDDGVRASVDCDDWDADIGAEASCPGDDEDGDGIEVPIDCDDSDEDIGRFCDGDGDGHTSDKDCNDADPKVYPGATEVCDGKDQDCDGSSDEGLATCDDTVDEDSDGFEASEDCDDNRASVNPDADEVCTNSIDDDCDGKTDTADSECPTTVDADKDGYASTATGGTDCDDTKSSIHPDADETCNGIDDDCNGTKDDGATDEKKWYADADGDGYGNAGSVRRACTKPSGFVADNTDCNDADATKTTDCSTSGGGTGGYGDGKVTLCFDYASLRANGATQIQGFYLVAKPGLDLGKQYHAPKPSTNSGISTYTDASPELVLYNDWYREMFSSWRDNFISVSDSDKCVDIVAGDTDTVMTQAFVLLPRFHPTTGVEFVGGSPMDPSNPNSPRWHHLVEGTTVFGKVRVVGGSQTCAADGFELVNNTDYDPHGVAMVCKK